MSKAGLRRYAVGNAVRNLTSKAQRLHFEVHPSLGDGTSRADPGQVLSVASGGLPALEIDRHPCEIAARRSATGKSCDLNMADPRKLMAH